MTRPQAIQLAQQMHQTGWTVTEIQQHLAEHDQPAAWSTVKGWADPDWHARDLARNRNRRRLLRGELPSALTPGLLLALRNEDHLTYSAIAKVVGRFFGERMSPDQARYRLYELGAPKNPNKTRTNAERQAA